MTSKTEQVKTLFEVTEKYLGGRQLDIRLRIDAVQEFTKNQTFEKILDIGCGDGSISAPLLQRVQKATLLDIAANMLVLAQKRIPDDRVNDVQLINATFPCAELEPHSFDLILCVGVLAHVDSPSDIIAEVARLAKPGASVILEFTDSFHFWGWPNVLYHQLLRLKRPAPYNLNRLKNNYVMKLVAENGLRPCGLYRYGLPPLGANKVATDKRLYQMTRSLYGPAHRNRNRWLANEFIYHLKKTEKSGLTF